MAVARVINAFSFCPLITRSVPRAILCALVAFKCLGKRWQSHEDACPDDYNFFHLFSLFNKNLAYGILTDAYMRQLVFTVIAFG